MFKFALIIYKLATAFLVKHGDFLLIFAFIVTLILKYLGLYNFSRMQLGPLLLRLIYCAATWRAYCLPCTS